MTTSPEKEAEIVRLLKAETWPRGTIARQIGVHHDVVDRIARQLEQDGARPAIERRPRAIDPYQAFIIETLDRYPDIHASRIHDMVKVRGYGGSERRTRAAVSELRIVQPRRAAQPVNVLAGEQSQIDWGFLGRFTIDGAQSDVNFFVLCLSWSRAFWAELVLELSSASLTRSWTSRAIQAGVRHRRRDPPTSPAGKAPAPLAR